MPKFPNSQDPRIPGSYVPENVKCQMSNVLFATSPRHGGGRWCFMRWRAGQARAGQGGAGHRGVEGRDGRRGGGERREWCKRAKAKARKVFPSLALHSSRLETYGSLTSAPASCQLPPLPLPPLLPLAVSSLSFPISLSLSLSSRSG